MMRVTFLLPGYPWGPVGGFRVVYQHANELVARGHRVTVLHARRLRTLETPGAAWSERVRGRLRRARDTVLRPSLWWQTVDPRVELRFIGEPVGAAVPDADVVFATAWQTATYVRDLPERKGRKHYLVQDFAPWLGSEEEIHETWRWPLRKVTVSSWLLEQVRTAGATDVVNIPNGIDRPSLGLRTPIAGRPKLVAMMYSRAPYKGIEDGIEALVRAKRAVPELEAVVFGAPRRPAGLPGWVRYERNLPDAALAELYNTAGVFLCSSTAEGFALPPAEAMACGAAVVTTDCGGNREYAEDGVTALVSPPGDPAALARNLVRVLEDENLRAALARQGHDRILRFTWARSGARLEEVLLAAAAHG